jgi:hypothetical protein
VQTAPLEEQYGNRPEKGGFFFPVHAQSCRSGWPLMPAADPIGSIGGKRPHDAVTLRKTATSRDAVDHRAAGPCSVNIVQILSKRAAAIRFSFPTQTLTL